MIHGGSTPRSRRVLAWGALAALSLVLCACAEDGSELDVLTDGGLQPTLASLQADVFGAICAECHFPNGSGPMPLDTEQNTYDSLVNVQSFELPQLLRVAPGDPENSYVIWKVEGRSTIVFNPMPPPPRPRLSQAQIDAIAAWIESGAPR